MNESIPFYRGHEGFYEILKDEQLAKLGRAIRVYNYAGFSGDEKLYVIGTKNQLFDAKTEKIVKPEDVLSKRTAPDGWSVESIELSLLPEDEINNLLK